MTGRALRRWILGGLVLVTAASSQAIAGAQGAAGPSEVAGEVATPEAPRSDPPPTSPRHPAGRGGRGERTAASFALAMEETTQVADDSAAESPAEDDAGDESETPDPTRSEWAGFPAIGYNTYYGAILGGSVTLTRFRPQSLPFHYRLSVLAVASIRGSDTGVISPLQTFETKLEMPALHGGKLRIFALARYQRIGISGYFGIGNAVSPDIPDDYTGVRDRYFTYERDTVEARLFARYRVTRALDVVGGTSFRAVFPTPHPDGAFARDIAIARTQENPILRGYERNFLFDGLLGFILDTRDDEFNPTRGGMHELSFRMGGGPSEDMRLRYGSVYLNTRWFLPIVGEKLVVAVRGIADVGFGHMPMLEMLSIGGYTNFNGPAGQEGNRGLPLGRQAGRVKLLASLELRSTFFRFQYKTQRFGLGVVAFADGSRVSSAIHPDPELDGRGFDVLWSFGGGVRILWGSSFVLRLDFGVSPNGGIGGGTSNAFHFVAGHSF